MRRWHGIVIGLLILAVGIAVRVEDPEMLQSLRLSVFAIYQRLHPRPYQPVPVRVVDVDDESLARYGQWPWPRTLVAKLVERLRQAEAAAVVLDVVFAEADRTSPQRIIGTLPDATQRRVLLEALQTLDLPNNDEALAGAIAGGRVVTGFAPADDVSALPHRVASFAFVGADPLTFALDFAGAVVNLPSLESGAAGNGALTVFPDLDGLVHRMPLLVGIADGLYPSLIAEGVRVGQGATTIMVKSSDVRDLQTSGTATGITDVKIGRFIAPTDRQGQFWLYDTGPVAERHIPAWKILGPRFDDKSVTGMIAVVGVTAAGLADTVSTPLNAVTTAAELNAQGMEQVLLGVFLQRPLWATGAEILFLAVLGLALTTAFLPRRFGAVTSTGLGALIIVAGVAVSWWAFTAHGLLLDPVYPVMIGLAIYLANALLKYMVSESQRKEVRAAFGQYVAPALVDELAKNPAALKLGGQSRDMTVLFCDVRDFTAISERLEPESLTRLLNHFLTMMSRQILSRRGTIDKYMGDAIMAFWNAPLPDPDHARHACETALAMIEALPEFNRELAADPRYNAAGLGPFRCGIGIDTGLCLVGNMGSDQRFDYSVVGNTVNVASRLEGQTKVYGVPIIIGEATHSRVSDFATLELDLIRVKGKQEAARIFAVLGGGELAASDEFKRLSDSHAALIDTYRSQDRGASAAALDRCRALAGRFGLDKLYALYAERLEDFATNPPGPDWDGVYQAKSK